MIRSASAPPTLPDDSREPFFFERTPTPPSPRPRPAPGAHAPPAGDANRRYLERAEKEQKWQQRHQQLSHAFHPYNPQHVYEQQRLLQQQMQQHQLLHQQMHQVHTHQQQQLLQQQRNEEPAAAVSGMSGASAAFTQQHPHLPQHPRNRHSFLPLFFSPSEPSDELAEGPPPSQPHMDTAAFAAAAADFDSDDIEELSQWPPHQRLKTAAAAAVTGPQHADIARAVMHSARAMQSSMMAASLLSHAAAAGTGPQLSQALAAAAAASQSSAASAAAAAASSSAFSHLAAAASSSSPDETDPHWNEKVSWQSWLEFNGGHGSPQPVSDSQLAAWSDEQFYDTVRRVNEAERIAHQQKYLRGEADRAFAQFKLSLAKEFANPTATLDVVDQHLKYIPKKEEPNWLPFEMCCLHIDEEAHFIRELFAAPQTCSHPLARRRPFRYRKQERYWYKEQDWLNGTTSCVRFTGTIPPPLTNEESAFKEGALRWFRAWRRYRPGQPRFIASKPQSS